MQGTFSSTLSASAEPRQDRISAYRPSSRQSAATAAKRGFDVTTALLLLVLFMPLIAAVVLLVHVAQGRPIFIRHKRVGKDGRLFSCLKFRTMVVNAEAVLQRHLASDAEAHAEWKATRKLKNDPRVTPLGQVMRKLSIDETPQLLNVLRGDMSLVGPRPIVPDEMAHYGIKIEHYCSVRPGLTGAWQVGGRSDVSYPRRVEMDADYVTNWSFGRDLSILARTIPAVVRSTGSY